MFAYSNNGLSFRAVSPDYMAGDGEVLFSDYATVQQLTAAFAGYTAAVVLQANVAAAYAAIGAGLTILSTGSSTINGVYACDPTAVSNFNAVETYVLRNNAFPNNATTQPWVQKNGTVIVIPSTTVFNDIATAVANYVAAVQVYIYSQGQAGSLPTPAVAIA